MSIQRYDFLGPSNNYPLGGMNESMLGHWVRYDDHVSALRACEGRINDEWVRDYGGHRAFALGVAAAREAVAGLPMGVLPTGVLVVNRDDALGAIDALRGIDG